MLSFESKPSTHTYQNILLLYDSDQNQPKRSLFWVIWTRLIAFSPNRPIMDRSAMFGLKLTQIVQKWTILLGLGANHPKAGQINRFGPFLKTFRVGWSIFLPNQLSIYKKVPRLNSKDLKVPIQNSYTFFVFRLLVFYILSLSPALKMTKQFIIHLEYFHFGLLKFGSGRFSVDLMSISNFRLYRNVCISDLKILDRG